VVAVSAGSGLDFGVHAPLPIERFIQPPPPGNPRNYDVKLDGNEFIVIYDSARNESAAAATPEIRVVINWFEELKRRVPVK
jgi:hypothetical protein